MEVSQTLLQEGSGTTVTLTYNEGEVVIGEGKTVQGNVFLRPGTAGIRNDNKIKYYLLL